MTEDMDPAALVIRQIRRYRDRETSPEGRDAYQKALDVLREQFPEVYGTELTRKFGELSMQVGEFAILYLVNEVPKEISNK